MALSVFADNTNKVVEALKEHYKTQRIKEMAYQNNPLLAMMPKYEQFDGENMPVPIILTGPQRRSATFLDGQGNSSTSKVKQFLLERKRDYSFASIEHEAIRASQSNAGAFVRYATMEIDGAIHSLKRSMAVAMYRDGTGAIGRVNSSDPTGGKVLTLATPADVTNFEVGMKVEFSGDLSAEAPADTAEITKVDRDAGKLYFKDNLASGVAANDYIVQEGDHVTAGDKLRLTGLDAWLPASAPTDESSNKFLGVDRSVDATRLAGNRFDGSSLPIEEALISGASQVAREGGAPDFCFMSFDNYRDLEKALGSKAVYDKVSSSDAEVGFKALVIHGPRGPINIIPDHNCIANVAFMLQLDTWSLNTLGPAPQILDLDGNSMLRETGADAYEVRVGYYGEVGCSAPGYNCRITLA